MVDAQWGRHAAEASLAKQFPAVYGDVDFEDSIQPCFEVDAMLLVRRKKVFNFRFPKVPKVSFLRLKKVRQCVALVKNTV